ncbi:hypothetical protein FH972_027183 [Carpinus fangiana]|uniref:Cyclic nucleotide-binding domain-containing protein n=1 Tax=Carpinus fangiana TaxID=176857 RepID=A0A5N6L6F5_9ROSI|nr:hypothetical protein FH972_027183 [Carpinus fangiana]
MATERAAKKAEMEAEKKKMEARNEEEIRIKMIPIRLEIESWMARDHLPDNMKEHIINCIQHRLEQKKDFDIEKPILHLSKDLITEIKRHICLPLLKKVVPNLAIQGDQNLLEPICESLKPKYYNEDSYILQEGEPLMMLFITQGSVCCFKTSRGDNSMGTDSDTQYIEKGEIWGEELLEWGFNRSSAHKKSVPISTKTVKTTSKVEAFALTAKDLKNLVPMHTRAAEATKEFVKEFFRTHSKENKNENSPKMSEQKGTSRLLEDGAPKSC